VDWRGERDAALLALERAEPAARASAAETLHRLAAEDDTRWEELAALIPRLIADPQGDVRRAGLALAALSLDPEDAERVLVRALTDAVEMVRLEAAGHLADLARASSRGALAAALEDSSLHVRFEAARGMAALRHSAGLGVLYEALGDDELRFRALGALGELGDPLAVPELERIFKKWFLAGFERTQAAGALAKLGREEGTQHLFDRVRKRWNMDRALAIELLGEVKAQGARERLLEVLRDPKDLNRGAAARGLAKLGDPGITPALAEILLDPKLPDDLRLDVAEALCALHAPEARSALERALLLVQAAESRAELKTLIEECQWS
jgi:HEAT repeat protein